MTEKLQTIAGHLKNLGSKTRVNQPHKTHRETVKMADSKQTTHVLNTAQGTPAAGLNITLYRLDQHGEWKTVNSGLTNKDGRLPGLISQNDFTPAVYKLIFNTESYFNSLGQETFYPFVEVVFTIPDQTQHYHVPLIVSPYSYSTYRGS